MRTVDWILLLIGGLPFAFAMGMIALAFWIDRRDIRRALE